MKTEDYANNRSILFSLIVDNGAYNPFSCKFVDIFLSDRQLIRPARQNCNTPYVWKIDCKQTPVRPLIGLYRTDAKRDVNKCNLLVSRRKRAMSLITSRFNHPTRRMPSSDQATQFVLDDARMMMIDGDSHGAVKNFEPQHILNTHACYYSRASVWYIWSTDRSRFNYRSTHTATLSSANLAGGKQQILLRGTREIMRFHMRLRNNLGFYCVTDRITEQI